MRGRSPCTRSAQEPATQRSADAFRVPSLGLPIDRPRSEARQRGPGVRKAEAGNALLDFSGPTLVRRRASLTTDLDARSLRALRDVVDAFKPSERVAS
jgi:hypothetical protein